MKKLPLLCLLPLMAATCTPSALQAQPKVKKGSNTFVYRVIDYGEGIDTQFTTVTTDGARFRVAEEGAALAAGQRFIPGYSTEEYVVDVAADSLYCLTTLFDSSESHCYLTASPFGRKDLSFDTAWVDGLVRYTCSVNSNKLEFYVLPQAQEVSPIPYYGRLGGLLVSYWRNGQCRLELCRTARRTADAVSFEGADRVSSKQLAAIKRQHTVLSTRIFDNVQLCWGKENSHLTDGGSGTPFDSVLHFAGGTLALKRIRLPHLPSHYQTFVEIHQRSNGDAYDRTGSLFVLGCQPGAAPAFLRGMNEHPDSLPLFTDRKGDRYQGIRAEGDTFQPPVELVRFFTSFGVSHFNDRVKMEGIEWESENYFKQEVTDLASRLQGEVWIGIWIGNYDGGGHLVTVDLKSYPGDYVWEIDEAEKSAVLPLFNTCNVLEMAGQNYGKFFDTDSLTVAFDIPLGAKQVRLRYITTGHGGWDGGDEFNPKANTILINGTPAFSVTPWRCDCGRYREWNPVSGNFWNGTSSSDYSRSGWCPGIATQPVYFDLSTLTPGRHTLTVAIPQGAPQAGSFSHWCLSGCLIIDK